MKVCGKCPSPDGCSAAEYCVIESRFEHADRRISAPVCSLCDRSAVGAWACVLGAAECAATSDLWGQWFLVQMYARDHGGILPPPTDR